MIISLLGLPNSGKSTLINAISNQKVSITDNKPNTTRDYVSSNINIENLSIEIIDLPGFINTPDEYLKIFQDNLDKNLERSDIIFLLIDSKNPNLYDFDNLVNKVRKYSKKIWLIVNKVDDFENIQVNDSIYKYQFEKEFYISAYHKKGIDLLKENIILASKEKSLINSINLNETSKLSIIGRPNVGKSSLFNMILDYKRSATSNKPGTTLDIISENIKFDDVVFEVSDTAGIPRKKQKSKIDRVGSIMSLKQIPLSSVTLIVIDSKDGLRVEDIKLIYQCIEENVSPIIVLNKWDLLDKDEKVKIENDVNHELHGNNWIKIVRTSTLNKRGLDLLQNNIADVHNDMGKRVTTSELNKFIRGLWLSKPPHPYRGKRAKIKYVNQYSTYPPAFAFKLNGRIPKNYERYIVSQLRKEYNFGGSAIKVKF